MTLKELRARFEKTAAIKKERAAEIDSMKAELKATESEILNAADRGDLEKYTALDNKKRELEAKIFVYSRSLPSAGNPLTREEVITSWDAFAASYNKDVKKQYEEYIAACGSLAKKYKALVSVQNAALIEREKALQMIGEPRDSQTLNIYRIPSGVSEQFTYWARISPELAFFEGKGFYTRNDSDAINQIIEDGVAANL